MFCEKKKDSGNIIIIYDSAAEFDYLKIQIKDKDKIRVI